MDVVMLISWSHYYNRRGMFMIEKLEEYGRFLFGWAFRAMQSEMTMQESLNAKSERAYLTGTEIALLEDSSLFIIGIGILVLMEAFFVVVVISLLLHGVMELIIRCLVEGYSFLTRELLHLMEECPESSCLIIRTEKLDNSKDWNAWKSKHGICCDKLNGKSYQCWIQKAFQSLDCPIAEPMLRYFIDRSAYAYQERRDGKDETIDLYQIAIFIKQIAFASMDAGVSKETIDQVVPAAVGKSWELASKLLLDPMEGMKLAVELFDHGNNSLKLYGMLLRNYRVAKKALLLSDMKENEILKLLGLTEKQMRGIRAYRKLPEERLDTVMSILIEAMNRTKISFGNERNLFIQTMAKLIIL